MTSLLIGGLGTTELVLILLVVVLLFGATKLPELARGSGRALRIFKAETKGLMDDDDKDAPKQVPSERILDTPTQGSVPGSTTTSDPQPRQGESGPTA